MALSAPVFSPSLSPRRRVAGLGFVSVAVATVALATVALATVGSAPVWTEGGARLAWEILVAAFDPAFTYTVPVSGSGEAVRSLWPVIGAAVARTLVFAVAAVGAALVFGLPMGLLGSRRVENLLVGGSTVQAGTVRGVAVRATARLARGLAVLLRSVHELLWAVLLLAALGLADGTAVLALALPYGGIFAKIFAEMIDEAPSDAADGLAQAGGGVLAVWLWGILPRALPDFIAYVFYRFECALRSSAVLGFFGFQTLGYGIAVAFENLRYGEMWTHLYALFLLVTVFDLWSAALRRRRVDGAGSPGPAEDTEASAEDMGAAVAVEPTRAEEGRRERVAELRARRPRDRFGRFSLGIAVGAILAVWLWVDLGMRELGTARRLGNAARFLTDLVPYPLRRALSEGEVESQAEGELRWVEGLEVLFQWFLERLPVALPALGVTLAIAVAAVGAAALLGALLAALARRRTEMPRLVGAAARSVALVLRGIPEYVWAFFLVALAGPSVWPVVAALALHNAGILARLGAETADDLEPESLDALRNLGAGSLQVFVFGVVPQALGRWLLFFFYRWETCVREATVLGMLGVVSLGYWIEDARARRHLDEMFFLVLCGALLVVLGDVVSDRVRRHLRHG